MCIIMKIRYCIIKKRVVHVFRWRLESLKKEEDIIQQELSNIKGKLEEIQKCIKETESDLKPLT